jgi:hypothetical protein
MQTVVQTATSADLYGRVFGVLQSMTAAFVQFATAIVGFVIQGAGLVPAIVGARRCVYVRSRSACC